MSTWRATKAKRVYAALLRLGGMLQKRVGTASHSAFTMAKKSARRRFQGSVRMRGCALRISDPGHLTFASSATADPNRLTA